MSDSMTGAQALVRSLEEVGADVVFGIPGGAILPAYDPLLRLHQGPAHPGPPRAGRRARRRGLRAGHRQGRRLHGDLRARAPPTWSPRSPTPTWTRCRWSRSPARSAAPMIGTDAFQEADISGITLPITKHNFLVSTPPAIPQTIAEAFHLAATGRPGPGARRHPEGRAAGADHLQLAAAARPARLPAGDPAARQADPRGGQADRAPRGGRCSTSAAGCSRPGRPPSCASWPS